MLPSLGKSIPDVIAEYKYKVNKIPELISEYVASVESVKLNTTIGGQYVGDVFGGHNRLYDSSMRDNLIKSAWLHIYHGLNIDVIASASDKKRFEMAMEKPPEFTLDNISATFGDYVKRPRFHILKGFAECFTSLDPSYKSHSKVKVGVAGLPKRIIMSGFGGYGQYAQDRLKNLIDSLLVYRGEPMTGYGEISDILDKMKRADYVKSYGLTFKYFKNGNCHIHFDAETARDINMALAEFYGEVLPDDAGEKPTERAASTAVSKDLQYYPTPRPAVDQLLRNLYIKRDSKVLEPSCGDGCILDALPPCDAVGVEFHTGRALEARAKGHSVVIGNFLEMPPEPKYDFVIMNPPFYGRHYVKHIDHAKKFLNEGGILVSILPATAWYDHGAVSGKWRDLPVGSFSDSGTNVPTGILTVFA